MSSLKEVINLQKRQHSRYIELKQNILNKLTDKITHLAKHGETRCIYTVPTYTFGSPTYNVADITGYLFYKFKNEGFYAIMLANDKLFISWDINDINKKNNKNKNKKQIIDIKPLINVNK
jgi:hypothetical protein|tara:strand:- start:259 stop:618 length:360 start_codon:yes stop_codon:yes gene_type:complete